MDLQELSILLQPYKEPVGTVAGVVTIAQFFSGAFICKDIYKKGSTDGISSNPFVGGIVIGLLMLKYSFILDDNVMLYVNISAIVLNVLYLLFYYVYARVRRDLFKSMSVGAGVIGVMLGYAFLERPDRLEYRFGLVVTVLMLLLLGSPLFEVGAVIKTKDASSIPFPIVLSGTVVSFLWFLYGVILLNNFMIFQNVVGLALCLVQLLLSFMYPGVKRAHKKMK